MLPEISYFIKINIALIIFYGFYRLFCIKDTFFHWRRFTLLAFLITSFIYPLLNIQEWIKTNEPTLELVAMYETLILPGLTITEQKVQEVDYATFFIKSLQFLYFTGVILLFLRFLNQIRAICMLAYYSKTEWINNIRIKIPPKQCGPFSFFGWIFMNPEHPDSKETEEILTHEQTHCRQYHSFDIILSELACILCWINPFIWLLKREVRINLEYMADNKVIQSGHNRKEYQYHLLGLAHTHNKAATTIYNNFNVLPIKNRIKMMNKKRTHRMGRTKYILFIPLTALLLLIGNIETVARMSNQLSNDLFQGEKKKYSGIVKDENNQPIPSVNIVVEGTRYGTITDKKGYFEIEANSENTLWFSYIGMATVKIPLSEAKENLSVKMYPEITEYDFDDLPNFESESPKTPDEEVFRVVEQMPEFPGGVDELIKFLAENIQYPSKAKTDGIEGRVIVTFTVEKDGSINRIEVARSVSPELDAEAIRVIQRMPKWKPGMQRGKEVAVKYTIPVTFKLPDSLTEANGRPNEIVAVETQQEEPIFQVVEKMPEFPGGIASCLQYLGENIRYPQEVVEARIEGRVIVTFVINKEGEVENVEILSGVNEYLDREAIRVVKNMPKWTPGMQRGEAVKTQFSLPIGFKLEQDSELNSES